MTRINAYWRMLLRSVKLIVAWVWFKLLAQRLLSKDIWLFEEKHTEARDNAFHLYKYVKENHPDINAFYVIVKGSVDEDRIEKYGSTIHADTLKHYIFWLSSKYSISSQPYGAIPYPADKMYRYRKLCRNDQKVIFLQHGIIKDDLPRLDYSRTGFDLFSCSAIPEAKYVCEGLHYPKENVRLIGLCRFDKLFKSIPNKIILIMPTFRHWLRSSNTDVEANDNELIRFKKSDFFKHYCKLLTNEELITCARNNDYKIIFYMHYALQSYMKAFANCGSNVVTIADRFHYDVQQLLIDSAVLITDYSSVFFDFAYMEKPEIFYQFDEKKYREEHYKQGYFDYRENAFGPVFNEQKEVIEYLKDLIGRDCKMDAVYRKRTKGFFMNQDRNNCQRTYNAIKEL